MSEVRASITINAPIADVWNLVMDATRLHEWVTIHRRLVDHDETSMTQVMSIRGAHFTVHWQLMDSDPPHHAAWRGRGPARSTAEIDYALSEIDGGTRFDYRNMFKAPGGILGSVASRALVGGVPDREAHASLGRLKKLLEG